MDRLTQLKYRLAASVNPDGTPIPGYALRVAMLEAEIARLETAGTTRGAATKDPAGLHPLSGEYGDHLA